MKTNRVSGCHEILVYENTITRKKVELETNRVSGYHEVLVCKNTTMRKKVTLNAVYEDISAFTTVKLAPTRVHSLRKM